MIDRIEAGLRFRDARKSKYSQEEAARVLGISRQQLSHLETGRRVPAWPRLVELVTTLGLDPRAIVPEFFTTAARCD